MSRPLISVVIPILNEAERLPPLLDALAAERTLHEVIVVDGGSIDCGPELARNAGATVLVVGGGRGPQLVQGAEVATGLVLLFLHADCRFPRGGLNAIAGTLARAPHLVGGNFALTFDGDDRFSRWLTSFYAWIRRRGIYYGDSGVFVRRDAYAAIGGFRPLALMEDFEFIRRLERFGRTICLDEPALATSSRRFAGRHPIVIVMGWLRIHALFYLGVDSQRLADLYRSDRRGG